MLIVLLGSTDNTIFEESKFRSEIEKLNADHIEKHSLLISGECFNKVKVKLS